MKTEKQVTDKLELVIGDIEKLSAGITSETDPKDIPQEARDMMIVQVSILSNLAWVLDCEEEMRPLLRAIRVQALADRLEGK